MSHPTILFDGVCNLCTGAVQFVLKRDKKELFRFASLQGNYGQQLLQQHPTSSAGMNSFLLQENGHIYSRSTAALRVARKLSGLWPLLYGFIIVPACIRDRVYDWISANRYRWFGKKEECWLPDRKWRGRFVD